MAIVSSSEIPDGRSGRLEYDWGRQYVRRWRVKTDNDKDGPLVATGPDAGLPTIGFPYATETEVDPLARVKSVEPTQEGDDPRLWVVTVQYDTRFPSQTGGGSGGAPGAGGGASPASRPANPLDEPVIWSASTMRTSRFATFDKDLKDYVNSAGVPFSQPPELYKPLLRITATKNYSTFPVSQMTTYFDKVNQQAWMGFAADSVLVDEIGVQEEYRNDVGFLRVNWSFLYDPDKWIPFRVLDRGYHRLVGGVLTPNTDTQGNLVEKLLDGAGGVTTTPTYLLFRNHNRVSFAAIP